MTDLITPSEARRSVSRRLAGRAIVAFAILAIAAGVLASCGDSDPSDSSEVSDLAVSAEEEPLAEPEPQLIESSKTFVTEREGSGGYTYEAELVVGGLLDGKSAQERGFVASSCEFDPQRDAVVPWSATVRNTTSKFDLELNLGIAWGDPEGAREYSVGMESDRDYGCGEPDGGVPGNVACCNLANPSGLAPQETTEAEGGFIFHDYYSPSEPEGDSNLLGELRFAFFSPTFDTTTCLSGPGVGGRYFTLDGTDLSKFEGDRYDQLPRVPGCG